MSDLTDLDSGDGAWPLAPSSGHARQSLVILRHVADLCGLRRVVIDPELGMVLGHQLGEMLSGIRDAGLAPLNKRLVLASLP